MLFLPFNVFRISASLPIRSSKFNLLTPTALNSLYTVSEFLTFITILWFLFATVNNNESMVGKSLNTLYISLLSLSAGGGQKIKQLFYENSGLLKCYNALTGKRFPTFRRSLIPAPSGSQNPINSYCCLGKLSTHFRFMMCGWNAHFVSVKRSRILFSGRLNKGVFLHLYPLTLFSSHSTGRYKIPTVTTE